MPQRYPEELSIEQLEIFLRRHDVRLPADKTNASRYRNLLIELSNGVLQQLGRETIHVEKFSLLKRVLNWKKNKSEGPSESDNESFSGSASVRSGGLRQQSNDRMNITSAAQVATFDRDDVTSLSSQGFAGLPERDLPSVRMEEALEALQDLTVRKDIQETIRPNKPPPLPPHSGNTTSLEAIRSLETRSEIEAPRLPPKLKRVRPESDQLHKMSQDVQVQDLSRPYESTRVARTQQYMTQPKRYTTKFTTLFDDKSDDIEQYLTALRRWQRLNDIDSCVAISVGLQNFKNPELANYTETALTPMAFTSLELFSKEVQKILGKTQEQWLDQFDSVKRRSSETCFTFFARLQSVLKNALGISQLNAEHKRLIVRKFLKSLHPTLRGHLESRDEPINFENAAVIAHRVELALDIPRGSTVREVHQISDSRTQNQRKKYYCYICAREGGHNTEFCFGNPNGPNFNLEKFKVVNGVSKN